MHKFCFYVKSVLIAIFIWLQTSSTLVAQDKGTYSELDLYRQTLQEEPVKEYQQALTNYQNTLSDTIHYSQNKKFCQEYHQLINLPDSTAALLHTKIEGLCHLSLDATNEQEKGYS